MANQRRGVLGFELAEADVLAVSTLEVLSDGDDASVLDANHHLLLVELLARVDDQRRAVVLAKAVETADREQRIGVDQREPLPQALARQPQRVAVVRLAEGVAVDELEGEVVVALTERADLIGLEAGNDRHPLVAGVGERVENVTENGTAVHVEQRLRRFVGEGLEASTDSRGENHCVNVTMATVTTHYRLILEQNEKRGGPAGRTNVPSGSRARVRSSVFHAASCIRCMEYDDTERATEFAERTRRFVDEVVIPVERETLGSEPVDEDVVDDLRERARERELYAPHLPEEYGGQGLSYRDMLPVFEAAGRSLLGPPAMRVEAPDEGNMHTLELFGTDEQKERWLEPLVAGEARSGFSMTEPMQGGGSDPKMLKTQAEKEGGAWVIDGHKWWTTQGAEADVLIVMARTDREAHPYEGCSLFLVPTDTEGVEIVREIPHVGGEVTGMSHAEIRFDRVEIPEENLLGELNEGFSHAQQRLGPARLTHCMRYSGMAERALDVTKAYVSEREGFDGPLAEKQAIRFTIAEAETNLHAARTMVRHAAREIESGGEARIPVAMTKVFAANTVQEVIDDCVQLCGANGIGKDLPLADFYENVRQFRIVDGADEVHKRVIARDAFSEVDSAEVDGITRYEE